MVAVASNKYLGVEGIFMKKEEKVANSIIEKIGGLDNIKSVEHCATRLRLILVNNDLIDKDGIEEIDGVKGQFMSAGQYQIVLGTGFVNKVYNCVIQKNSNIQTSNKESLYKNMSMPQKISRTLGDIFVPIIPVLVATGLFMGVRGLLTNLGVEMSSEFLTLTEVLTDTAFAFLPALVAYSTMKKFGGNPVVGIVLGLMLVATQLPNAYSVASGDASPLMLKLMGLNIPVLGYQGSVLPALVISMIAAKLEIKLHEIVPNTFDLIVTPFVTLLVSMILGLLCIGPVMHEIEQLLLSLFKMFIGIPFGIGGAIVGGLCQPIVVTGVHHVFSALEIELLAENSRNVYNAMITGAIAAQGAATIAVALKTKNTKKKALYMSSALPAFLGITEPAIFGVNLRLIKPFVFACIGGAASGLFAGIMHMAATGMGVTVLPGILLYLDGQLAQYIVLLAIGIGVSFTLTYLFYKAEE